ncbi:helix-turn-helix transcriptional regulator [Novosphingobium terrae]|uniref:helix-turn-helix transcriptional regulator n=1 Tax=Novosphingobium terrae TaxID=2726189 RepID=UPI00197E8569|nr:AlpA family phage regulatory protein [Novosphingobium terrae]
MAECEAQEAPFEEPPDRLLRIAEVSRRVGLCKAMIYRLISREKFPRPFKVSPGASRWSERAVVAWIADVRDGFEGKRRKFW